MSPQAIEARLKLANELTRVCWLLGQLEKMERTRTDEGNCDVENVNLPQWHDR